MAAGSSVLFDLDGTLSDGAAGMLESLAIACEALGLPVPAEDELRGFIGPPLEVAFAARFGLGPSDCARALAAYRRHYVDGGAMFDAVAYPGVADLLAALSRAGCAIAVATSKPQVLAERIVEHLGLAGHVAAVFGPALDGTGADKADVVAAATRSLGLDPDHAVMVGDREHDVRGAAANAMGCIGVLWGHGSATELARAGAIALARDAGELTRLLFEDRTAGAGTAAARRRPASGPA